MAGREFRAHVARWILEHREDVPVGCEIHHSCRTRGCVNVAHLQALTREEHRRIHAPDFCPNGHAYSTENTGVDSRGCRYCRRCRRAQQRDHRQRKKGEMPAPTRRSYPSWAEGPGLQCLAATWLKAHHEVKVRPYVAPWGEREFAMMRWVLREHPIDEAQEVLRAVIHDWDGYKAYAVQCFGAWRRTDYPSIYYLTSRNHWEAAVCWHREQVAAGEEQRAREESVRVEQERRQAETEAEERRLEELRRRPFEDVRDEVLQDLVTPDSVLNLYFRRWVGPQVPEALQLRALDQRATAEARRLQGDDRSSFARREGVGGPALTEAELEAHLWDEVPAAS